MATTLLDHLRSAFTSSSVNDLARALGESTAPVQKGLDGLMPAVTSAVINQASTDEGVQTLYNLLQQTPFDTDPSMNRLVQTGDHRQKAAESGNALLRQLFGDRTPQLAEAAASYSGVSSGSATVLTGLVTSVLMGYLHNLITSRNLTPAQLAAFLRGEADDTRRVIPAALAGMLLPFIGMERPATTVASEPVYATGDNRATGTPWWRWLLYGLILLLLLLFLLRACNRDKTETSATTTGGQETGAVVNTDTVASDLNGNGPGADSTGASANSGNAAGPEVRVGVDLPGGRRLNVVENSFNYALARYLATKGSQPNEVFTFDNLTFETDSATITAQARTHVNDLIEIMKAYPTLSIRIEGNTDSTGDDAINDPLSDQRAEAVKKALTNAGISPSRVATRGLGSEKPVTTNQTPTGREKNRRIDVVVTKI